MRSTMVKTSLKLVTGMIFVSLMTVDVSLAAGTTLSAIKENVTGAISNLIDIIGNIALIAGIGFILASLFKFDQHKKNPTQIQISQPIALLLVGAALCLFPAIIQTTATALYGTGGDVTKQKISDLVPPKGT